MADFFNLTDFLDPLSLQQIAGDETYRDGQIGKQREHGRNERIVDGVRALAQAEPITSFPYRLRSKLCLSILRTHSLLT